MTCKTNILAGTEKGMPSHPEKFTLWMAQYPGSRSLIEVIAFNCRKVNKTNKIYTDSLYGI